MKKIAIVATAAALALAAPAFAQNAQSPGAAGVGGGGTGANPGTGPATSNGDVGGTTYTNGRAAAPDDAKSGAVGTQPNGAMKNNNQ